MSKVFVSLTTDRVHLTKTCGMRARSIAYHDEQDFTAELAAKIDDGKRTWCGRCAPESKRPANPAALVADKVARVGTMTELDELEFVAANEREDVPVREAAQRRRDELTEQATTLREQYAGTPARFNPDVIDHVHASALSGHAKRSTPLADFGRDFPNVERVLTSDEHQARVAEFSALADQVDSPVPFITTTLYPTDRAFTLLVAGTSDRLNPVTGRPMVWITYAAYPELPAVEIDPEFYTAYPAIGPDAFNHLPADHPAPVTTSCCSSWRKGVDCGCADAAERSFTGFESEPDDEFNALADEHDPAAARRERDAGPVPLRVSYVYRIPTGERLAVLGTVQRDAIDYPKIAGTPGVYLQGENDSRPHAVFEPALSTCFTARNARVAYVKHCKTGVLLTVDGPVYDEFGNARMHLTEIGSGDVRQPKMINFTRRYTAVDGAGCLPGACGHRERWNEPATYVADSRAVRTAAQLENIVRAAVKVATARAVARERYVQQPPTRRGRVFFLDVVTGERLYRGVRIPPAPRWFTDAMRANENLRTAVHQLNGSNAVPPTAAPSLSDAGELLREQALGRVVRENGPCLFGDACEVHGDPATYHAERQAFWQALWTKAGGTGELMPHQLKTLRMLDEGSLEPLVTLVPRTGGYHGWTM